MTIHPQVQALIDAQNTAPDDDGPPSLEAVRNRYLALAVERGGAVELVDAAEDVVFGRPGGGSVLARVYTPQHGVRVPGLLVWIHGGGWCIGDLDGFDRVCRSLANAGGMEVASVDYRLAPECPYPAPLDDVRAAIGWAVGRGGPVVLGGDSAGANLATVALRGAEGVCAQVLVYPVTDGTMSGASYADADQQMLRVGEMESCWTAYRGALAADHPDVSPLHADLAGLPPALVVVAGHDILRSDGEAYAEALRAAGVAVELSLYEDMTHGFLRWGGVVDRSRELIAEIAAYTAAALEP
ncbi:MAG: alpha/beta hydrolase [Solirubrobacterales bacterium]|nr:alpha/beta hydrolase [Solirubrobacterales bacterium]